jgi:hypothetical protein
MGESIVCVLTTTNSEICSKQTINCQLCEGLSLELHKTQQDIVSYEKVIELLREELTNMDQRARPDGKPRNVILDDQHTSPTQQDGWRQVPFMTREVKSTRNTLLTTTLPTQNKFGPLTNLKVDSELPSRVKLTKPRSIKVKNHSAVKHNILIAGDSHARDSASRLQYYLGDDYSVSSFVKLGAPMEDILTTVDQLKASVKREDVLVVWGGSNNISRNNTGDAISNTSEFVKNSSVSNIVLMNAPHRHDLIPNSCVNKEVAKYNRLMRKVAKQNSNIQFLELDLDRSHFQITECT